MFKHLYAAIDLGSNSFHMLVVRRVNGGIQTVAKIKRKVRLAAGLDENLQLSLDAMERGWECLALFAERLQDIPKENIRIVGTATLRLAKNVDEFLARANHILGHRIQVISGEEEAERIYRGAAYTSSSSGQRLMIDIGGASTELIVGKDAKTLKLVSLNLGCVTFREKFFPRDAFTSANFEQAIKAACEQIQPLASDYQALGWQVAEGASGTVQAVQEIMLASGLGNLIRLQHLEQIKQQMIACETLEKLEIPGLKEERKAVLASGLSILIAIFTCLEVEDMMLAQGALREGLIYDMLPELGLVPAQQRTMNALMTQYNVDQEQAERVAALAHAMAVQSGQLNDAQIKILINAAQLHEIGLQLDFRHSACHGAYILKHTPLPGFSALAKSQLTQLVGNGRECFEPNELGTELALPLVILRLAIQLAQRRKQDTLPSPTFSVAGSELKLSLEAQWLSNHPLIKHELEAECSLANKLGFELALGN